MQQEKKKSKNQISKQMRSPGTKTKILMNQGQKAEVN